MQLTSTAFANNQIIPDTYTCRAIGMRPLLSISDVPPKAQTLVIIMHDPDAPQGDFLHWTIWNIPPATSTILEDNAPVGALEGINDAGKIGYMPPCPPAGSGTHHYTFDLYALDCFLDLPAGATRQQLVQSIQGHVFTQTTLVGLVEG